MIIVILNGHKISSLGLALDVCFIASFRRYILFLVDYLSFLDTSEACMTLSLRKKNIDVR
jgi:hypothetical protein